MAGRRTRGVVRAVDTTGNALLVQLACFVASLPLVTALPATVAAQQQLAAIDRGEVVTVVGTLRLTGSVFRRRWQDALVAAFVGAGLVLSVPFWAAARAPLSWLALGALAFVGGLAAGVLINYLVVADRDGEEAGSRWPAAWQATARNPLRTLWGVVLLLTWLVLAAARPMVLVVGSSLVPALVARYTLSTREERQASLS